MPSAVNTASKDSVRAGNGIGLGGWRAPCAVRVLGRLAAVFIPSGVPTAGFCGGMGCPCIQAGSRALAVHGAAEGMPSR
jgi:hypothetical protein